MCVCVCYNVINLLIITVKHFMITSLTVDELKDGKNSKLVIDM